MTLVKLLNSLLTNQSDRYDSVLDCYNEMFGDRNGDFEWEDGELICKRFDIDETLPLTEQNIRKMLNFTIVKGWVMPLCENSNIFNIPIDDIADDYKMATIKYLNWLFERRDNMNEENQRKMIDLLKEKYSNYIKLN